MKLRLPFSVHLLFLCVSVVGLTVLISEAADEYTNVMLASLNAEEKIGDGRPWRKPNYSDQEGALGYYPGVFAVPPGLEKRVAFWIDIYSKYTTNQGVLHDSQYMELVFEPIDFTDISQNSDLPYREKQRARDKRVKAGKERIKKILAKLHKQKDTEGLDEEELRIWNMYGSIDEKNKFKEAIDRVRFQLGQKDRIQLGIYYSGRYLERMEQIFREAKMPVELTRMPFVESSFNIYARSKVGASGIWQFMRSTGRSYMKVSGLVDERNDPLVATRSASRKLRDNYQMLQAWPLAITAYNHGPSGVMRVSNKAKTRDIVELIERGSSSRFGFASKNFYACFLAILEVEKNADIYLGRPIWSPELQMSEFILDKAWSYENILNIFAQNEEQARLFNPHLGNSIRRGMLKVPRGTRVYIPADKADLAKAQVEQAGVVSAREIQSETKTHLVKRGDTLSAIAKKYNVSADILRELNNISGRRLRPGTRLEIPVIE